jgi:hypothetical protein
MTGRRLIELSLPPILGGLLSVISVAVVLFRIFAVTFFWSSVSKWTVVPALVIVAMIFIASLAQTPRRYLASVLAICYLCSIYFDGWTNVTARIAEGGNAWFEATEAAVIAIFMLLHLISDGHLSGQTK